MMIDIYDSVDIMLSMPLWEPMTNFKITYKFKGVNMSEHKVYSSVFVQLMSVVQLAKALGWEYKESVHSFTTTFEGKTRYMSFNNMQSIHNNPYETIGMYIPHGLVKYACSRKIVTRSKLQWDKTIKEFITQSDYVEFC